ncbi:MAG: sugar transferase [Imperialibacter sp.]|uniref:sugar transferase n=1 Tax=Imperialibacter sp. TaxID=2038411 RepID=UPI0032EC9EFF
MKRIMDMALAVVGLVVASPLFLLLTAICSMAFRGRPFFVQERAGWHGKPLKVIKFRSMKGQAAPYGDPKPDAERLTSLGRWIRASSLDELPQLFSVLKGDMSLVGPRPLLVDYIPLYNERQRRRLLVRPGITGWAQVNGRNAIPWQQRFELDVWYVEHQSFWLDCKILWMTVIHLLWPSGINAPGHATMDRFRGN